MHLTPHGTHPPFRSRRRSLAAGALMALTLLVVACMGDDNDGPTPSMVTLRVEGSGAGQVAVDNTARSLPYEFRALAGTTLELEALPAAGNLFVRWEDELSGADNPATVTLNATLKITAVFEPEAEPKPEPEPMPKPDVAYQLQVVRSGDGSGQVTSAPSGIDCGSSCSASYAEGTSVSLTPAPDADAFVVGWGGCDAVSGDACTLTLDADRSATVTFGRTDVAPSNDDLANRATLVGAQGSTSASTASASKETGEPDHAGESGGTSLWWSWTPPMTGRASFDVVGSDVPAVVAAYTGTSLGDLTPVTAVAPAESGGAASISFDVVAGAATYLIAIDTVDGAEGIVRLAWSTQGTVSWSVDPGSLAFTGQRGGSAPSPQSLSITNTGSSASSFGADTDQPAWLSVSPTSGSLAAGDEATLSVSVGSCTSIGSSSGSVEVSGGGSSVSATVTRTCEGASWSLQPTALAFASMPGDPAPAAQSTTLRNAGNVTASFSLSSDRAWLSAAPSSGTVAANGQLAIDVSVDACGTFNALRTGTVTVSGGGHDAALSVSHDCRVPAPVELSIDRIYVNQAVPAQDSAQTASARIPLVAGRPGLLRAFATSDGTGAGQASATVHYRIGGGSEASLTLSGPTTVPLTSDEGSLATTYDVTLPSAAIQPNVELYVVVEAVADGVPVSTRFPASGWWSPSVVSVPSANFTLVPVTYAGSTPSVSSAYLDLTMRMHPIAGSTDVLRTAYPFDGDLSAPKGVGWEDLLWGLYDARDLDGSSRHYVGIVDPQYNSGIAGIGFVGYPVAVAWNRVPSAYEVVAHELGHNWDMEHTACGEPGGEVDGYPHADGAIGVWGYDRGTGTLHDPTVPDIMGYCNPAWISDYTYGHVTAFRSSGSFSITTSSGPEPLLTVRGRVDGGSFSITRVLRIDDRAPVASDGPYTVVAVDIDGVEVARASFDLMPISLHDAELFHVDAPLSRDPDPQLARVWIERDGVILAERVQQIRRASVTQVTLDEQRDGSVRVRWDVGAHPFVMIRDGVDGALLTNGRSGDVVVHPSGRTLQLLMSDGLNTKAVVIEF